MFIRFDLMYYLLFNIFIYASVMTFIMFFFASFAYVLYVIDLLCLIAIVLCHVVYAIARTSFIYL